MSSAPENLVFWIIVKYHLHSCEKGPIVYYAVCSVLFVSLYNSMHIEEYWGIRCNLVELLTLLKSCLSDLFPSVHNIEHLCADAFCPLNLLDIGL